MFDAGSIIAKVKADISEFKAGMQEAQAHAGGFQNALGAVGDAAAFVVKGLAIAGAATAAFGALSLKEYSKSEDAVTQLQAALTSTHEAAGLYIDDLLDQAAALQKVTKFSDEQVESAQALLLTFTNIKGVTFQKATNTILDMATALKMDATGAAQILGKALNAPVEGLAALSRIGIRFSDSQKEVIQTMVETGQTAKAQDVILQELNKRFGGSAVAAGGTLSGQLTRLKNIWSDLMENIGRRLANTLKPMIDAFLKWIDSMGGAWGIFDKLNTGFNILMETLSGGDSTVGLTDKKWIDFANSLMNIYWTVHDFVVPIIHGLKEAWDFLKPSITALWQEIQTDLVPALQNLWENFLQPLMPFIGVALVVAIRMAIDAIRGWVLLIALVANVLGDFGHIISDTAYDLTNFFTAIPGPISRAFSEIRNYLSSFWDSIEIMFQQNLDSIIFYFNHLPEEIGFSIGTITRILLGFFTVSIPNFINGMIEWFSKLPSEIGGWLSATASLINGWLKQTSDNSVASVGAMVNGIIGWFVNLPNTIANLWNITAAAFDSFRNAAGVWASQTIDSIGYWFTQLPSKIWSAISGMGNQLKVWFKNIGDQAWQGFKDGMGIHSPSYIEKALMKVVSEGKNTVDLMQKQMTQLNAFGASATVSANQIAIASSPSVTTNIYGNINNGSQTDRDAFFRRLTRNQELAAKGLATKPGSVG